MSNTPTQRNTRSNSNAQNITLNDIKKLIESKTDSILNAVRGDIDGLKCEIFNLNENVKAINEKLCSLSNKNNLLEKKVENLESQMQTLHQKQKCELSAEDMIYEAEERFKRRKFLIISGAQERCDGSVEERKKHDEEYIAELCNQIGIKDFKPEETFRIGPIRDSKKRLLRFKCSNEKDKRTILQRSRNLRNFPKFEGVFINPDLTRNQRRKNAELRQELRMRRNAGENVAIRRGCVINLDQDQDFQ